MAAAGKIEQIIGVVVVVAEEARASKVHPHQVRGSCSKAVRGSSCPSPGFRRNAIVAVSPTTGITSALQ